MKKAKLTLYTVIGQPERIPASIEKHFRDVTKTIQQEDEETELIFQDNSRIIFHLNHKKNRPSFISSHISGMVRYFGEARTENHTLKENVLRQIACFNCVVGIVFETDNHIQRTDYIINTLFSIAREINGFLLYPDMHIYNGQGQLVFSSDGKSELTEFNAIANTDILKSEQSDETTADLQRREKSIRFLKEKNIPFLPQLRTEFPEREICLKRKEEMVRRAIVLFALAVYSEVLLSENPDPTEARNYFDKIDEIYSIRNDLTPLEETYLNNPDPSEAERIQFLWKYECCAVLLWASGIVEELPYPSEICDIPVIAAIFWQHKNFEDLFSKGIPRKQEEIADAADLTLRYDWACTDARMNQKDIPASLDAAVVMERHYTFNWLLGANQGANWDEIQPNT